MTRNPIHISIPKPCHESWGRMDATAQGAFCHSCQKEVIDFSAMTDREVAEYLAKHQTGCGRFRKDQLDTKLSIPQLDNGIFKWRVLLLGVLPFISLKTAFASSDPVRISLDQKDTAAKSPIDTVQLKEVAVNPQCKMVGQIAVASTKDPIYQVPTRELDSIPEPIIAPVVEDRAEIYLTAIVGGITVINQTPTPGQKIKYWFRRTFRIKKHYK
jgi:hypothetical protein